MTLGKKLQTARKRIGLTQEGMASKLGITRASVGAYEEDRAVPRFQILKQICQLAGIEMEELIGSDIDNVRPSGSYSAGRTIPLVPVKAAAGYQTGYPDAQFISELPHLSLPILGSGDYRAFEISGDSMLPIVPGTIVIGERLKNISEIKDGKKYVMVTKSEGIVYKRVFNYIKDNGQLFLVSDNSAYKPYSMDPMEVYEVWSSKAYLSWESSL